MSRLINLTGAKVAQIRAMRKVMSVADISFRLDLNEATVLRICTNVEDKYQRTRLVEGEYKPKLWDKITRSKGLLCMPTELG